MSWIKVECCYCTMWEGERKREREEVGGVRGFTEEDVDETMNGESTYQN